MTIERSKSSPLTEKVPLSKILDDISNIEDWYIVPKRKELYIKLRSYSYANLLKIRDIIKENDYHDIEVNEID
jgi:hypothetical protein